MIRERPTIYDGNQLKKVTDAGNDPVSSSGFDFVDGADVATEYSYDANGNMTEDANKAITSITYNVLNLPQRIEYSDGAAVDYLYAADGRKLSKNYTFNTRSVVSPYAEECVDSRAQVYQTFYYCGNVEYNLTLPVRLKLDGGYFTIDGRNSAYHYYVQDYQGNYRAVTSLSGTLEQKNHYYPFGALLDISTNGDVNAYKYNGKELDRVLGLNLYDYHARQYDAALGRFTTMDPMAEKYYSISPYAYCANNPVNAVDPMGEDEWKLNEMGEIIERIPTDEHDAFFIVDDEGNEINRISFSYGTVEHASTQKTGKGILYDVYQIRGDKKATQFFEFMAKNTKVEWSKMETGIAGKKGLNFLTTSHMDNREYGLMDLFNKQLKYGYTLRAYTHNHPRNTCWPSMDYDVPAAQKMVRESKQDIRFFVYPNKLKIKQEYFINTTKDKFSVLLPTVGN